MSTDLAQLAADRYDISDALHQFAFGLDHGDADSLSSALTEDCVLDFRPAGRKLGLDFPKLTGRQSIVDALIPLLGPLDTSHTVSNLQIEINEDSATLYAYVMAQHFMPRQGPRPGTENALLMNRFACELVRDGQKWRFQRMVIDNAWAQGNPEILNALATHRLLSAKAKRPK
jgi:SnoaL-like domain